MSRVTDHLKSTPFTAADENNRAAYDSKVAVERYRNFTAWLFETFNENEDAFRARLVALLGLRPGNRALVTGCGLGDDIPPIVAAVGPEGQVEAQDLSRAMVEYASARITAGNVDFSISSALDLPYPPDSFDAVFHFGGINGFGDVRKAISEMNRVCKAGGRVVFGDEGIAPHLRGSEYAKVAIENIPLWAEHAPMDLLPETAGDIELRYVLGNCFYVISFTAGQNLPHMNIDVPHKGRRGGTARTRYFGRLEGVTEATKAELIAKADRQGISVHELLERILGADLSK